MRQNVLERLLEHVVGQLLAAHALVHLRGLHEAPRVGQAHHVVVNQHRGVDDLSRAGIDPRGAHGVGHGGRHVPDAGVFQVVGIELGVVRREVLDAHDVLESELLESLVPAEHAAADRLAPQLGEGVVEVEDDRLDRFDELAALPCLHVGGLHAPAVDDREILDLILLAVEPGHAGEEDADARIRHAGLRRLLGQQQDRARHLHGHRLVLLELDESQQVGRDGVGKVGLDRDVVLEGLDLVDGRTFALELAGDAHHAARTLDRGEGLVVAREEFGHVHHDGRAVAVVADELVGVDDRRQGAAADGLEPGRVAWIAEGRHDGLREVERRVDAREFHVHRVLGLVADGAQIDVAGLRNGGGDEHLAADRLQRNFRVELALELVQRQERTAGRLARLVIDEHFGVFVHFRLFGLFGLRFFLLRFRFRSGQTGCRSDQQGCGQQQNTGFGENSHIKIFKEYFASCYYS